MKRLCLVIGLAFFLFSSGNFSHSHDHRPTPPIVSRIKPHLWKRMIETKEIIVNAKLEDLAETQLKRYSFYTGMFVSAGIGAVRQAITNYRLYPKMIPYVDHTNYFPQDRLLKIEGGIWNYRLHSEVSFDELTDEWIHYKVVGGNFSGLSGNILFNSLGEKGTVVYLSGEQIGQSWPPRFVIERGAEIVFDFTARQMRSFIEAQKKVKKGIDHEQKQEFPQPRRRI